MQPETTRIFSTKPSLNLRGELMGATRPQKADSGSLFTEEFERATRLESSTDAEMRHDTRNQERTVQETRTGRQDSADQARDRAKSSRMEADSVRGERSAKRADRREDASAEPSQVSGPVGQQRPRTDRKLELGTERVRGDRTGAKAQTKDMEAGRPHADPASAGLAPSTAAPQAAGTQIGNRSQAGAPSQATGSTQAAAPVRAPSPGQTSTGDQSQMNNRPSTKAAGPGGETPVDAPDARDAMEKLLVERENRMEREASILKQIKASMKPGGRELSVRLSPASLGKVDLNLAVREGRLTAVIRTETPEAYEALERQMPEMQAALETQGIEVAGFDLELASEAGESGAFRDHAGEGNQPAAPAGNLSLGTQVAVEASAFLAAEIRATRSAQAANRGGVDTVG